MRCVGRERGERGTVLIVVMGVLAILSLIAAMFGMMMIVELNASRNQTEYEMARQAAQAGYEYLLQNLQNFSPADLRSGEPPHFCPDPSNPYVCDVLYRRGSLLVGWMSHAPNRDPEQHVNLVGAEWTNDLGNVVAGMFNVKSMGHAGDMGEDLTSKQMFSSYDVSLVHLLKSVFDEITEADIDGYYGGFTTTEATRLRVARLLAHAIVNYRYGNDGIPGRRGCEERRHDHIPDWRLSTPWLWANDPLADSGAAVAGGLFWGRAEDTASTTSVIADTTQATWWRDWPLTRWTTATHYVYMATGELKGQWRTISAHDGTTLTVSASWDPPTGTGPRAGDVFCIVPGGDGSGYDFGPADGRVTALRWPNGALSCEDYAVPLAISRLPLDPAGAWNVTTYHGRRTIVDGTGLNTVEIDSDDWDNDGAGDDLTGFVIKVVDGGGAGQVRRIVSNAGTTLSLAAPWSSNLSSVVAVKNSTFTTGGTNDFRDTTQTWMPNEHVGRVLEILDGAFEGTKTLIQSNTVNQIHIAASFGAVTDGTAYRIVYQTYVLEADFVDSGTVTNIPANNQLRDSSKSWDDNEWIGCVVNIYQDATTPDAYGQSRLVLDNTADTLTVDRSWRTPPSAGAAYRIELPQDCKYRPDTPRGDDRAYHAVPDILPVMMDALQDDGLSLQDAANAAALLYDACKDYLSVTSRRITKKDESASVNDWRFDGIDNNDNFIIDEADRDGGTVVNDEADYEKSANRGDLAKELYDRLGLRDWAHELEDLLPRRTRIEQAAQLVANIIDFRDLDSIPTRVTKDDLAEGGEEGYGSSKDFTVYGAEGLHVTEVMCTPDATYSALNGTELADDGAGTVPPDGLADGIAWDWAGDHWTLFPDSTVSGRWQFSSADLRAGWYAIRLRGGEDDVLTFTHTPSASPQVSAAVTTNRQDGTTGEYWGYARDSGDGRLIAVEVVDIVGAGRIQFEINGAVETDFYGFQLLPIYVEITNIARTDIDVSRYQLTVESILGTTNPLNDPTVPTTNPLTLPDYTVVSGATADGSFPINYGFFVIAMSQEAYDRQWGSNDDGTWGDDESNEDYRVWFAGDRASGEADNTEADERADALLLSNTAPAVALYRREATVTSPGYPMAGGDIDGDIADSSGHQGISTEKESPLGTSWVPYMVGPTSQDMLGSQNRRETTYTPNLYTCLNRNYTVLWAAPLSTGYPETAAATFAAGSTLAANDQVLPIIADRPYPSPGWLGLVPVGNIDSTMAWRTIDRDPNWNDDPPTSPGDPTEMLGLLLNRALTGGVHARVNLNNPSEEMRLHTFRAVFPDDAANSFMARNMAYTGPWTEGSDSGPGWRPAEGWVDAAGNPSWDVLLNTASVYNSVITGSIEDSGSSLWADDFEDDSDEEEEWARRYSAVLDMRMTNFKYVIAGFVYDENRDPSEGPVAQVRIQVDLDISGDNIRVVGFRYLSEF